MTEVCSRVALLGYLLFFVSSVNSMTLKQAIEKTLVTNPDVRVAWRQYQASEQDLKQSFSGYLPTVDLTWGVGRERADRTGQDETKLTRRELNLEVSQPIFNGFETLNSVKRSRYLVESRLWSWRDISENTSQAVVDAYLNILRQKQLLELSRQNLSTHQHIYKKIEKRTIAGVGRHSDLEQIKGRLARASSSTVQAENSLLDSRATYYRLVDQAPGELKLPETPTSWLPKTLEQAQYNTKLEHPAYKAAQFDLDAAHANYQRSKSSFFPSLALELERTINKNANGFDGRTTNNQAMLRMRYNLFNGWSDIADITASVYQREESLDSSHQVLRNLYERQKIVWSRYQALKYQMVLLNQYVSAAQSTAKVYTKQFELGQRSLLDLLNSENELFDARSTLTNAKIDFLQAKFQLLHSMGLLLTALKLDPLEAAKQDQ